MSEILKKQLKKTVMSQNDDAAVHATSLIINNAPKPAWQRQKKKQQMCLIAGTSKSKNIVAGCLYVLKNKTFAT